ncbi:damage-inducible protein CinA [Solimonas fluminis]|uniref:Damage-inducible protein CinA n=1 Tax=Solimonas fluminis TaxID=2086571 RepID=A0A2S5TLA7_9GAMM|nr:CinA family protein [Solimonas fluminis]PPE75776.1 damage-inducible protein CinA [Solimonas fluminis]
MPTLVEQIAELLLRRGEMLACAESCTGGLIAKTLTDLAGSSAWFERGFITYSNRSKAELLGVPEDVLIAHGAVSGPTVEAMGEGLIRRCPVQWGIAVSGVAGPSGGTPAKPVGTVWIGWSRRGADGVKAEAQHFLFDGDREAIREQALQAALAGLLQRLESAA